MRRRQMVLHSACMCVVVVAFQQPCAAVQTLTELQSFGVTGSVSEALYSSQYNTLFLRGSTSVRAINATTGAQVSLRAPSATGSFTDFMFTPSGQYLYAADYGGTNIGYGTPSYPSFVHRYDMQTQAWTSAQVSGIAYRVEPVDDNRVLLLEVDQWVDMTLNSYAPGASSVLTSISPGYSGDIEYDAATGRIFYNETGISSTNVRSFTLSGNTITAGQTVAGGSYSSTRAVLSSDGASLYYGRNEINPADLTKSIATFPESISAAAPTMAFGSTHYYDPATGAELGVVGYTPASWTVGADGREAWSVQQNTTTAATVRRYKITESYLWNATTGGGWGDIASWSPGTAPAGADNTADFSRKTLTADATVGLNGARVIGHLVFGDVGAARNWTLNPGSGGNLTLQVTAGTPKVTVNNQTATIGAVVAGTQGLTKAGVGTLVLGASNTYTGGTTIDAGTLVTASDANLGAGTLTINAGTFRSTGPVTNARQIILGNAAAAIQVDGAASYTVGAGGGVSGTGGLTKLGTGTLNLVAATANYGGPTTVSAGTLSLGAFGNSAAIGVATGASLNVTGTNLTLGAVTNNGVANFTGNTGTVTIPTLAGTGTTTFAGNAAVTTVGGGAINFNGPTATVGTLNGASVALNAGTALSVGSGAQTAGAITGPGSLTKTGTGTLTLAGDNTYAGGTTISGGTLQLGNGGTSGSIVGNVVNNGALAVNRTDAHTLAGAITGTGSLTMAGTGTLTLTGNNAFSGGTTLSAGTLAVGAGSNLGTGAISIFAGTLRATSNIVSPLPIGLRSSTSAVSVDPSATYAVTSGAAVSGTGGLTKLGGGLLDLSAAAVGYSGATSVQAGTLNVGNFNNTSQVSVIAGAAMNLSGSIVSLGALNNAGTVAFTNPAASVALGTLGGTGTTSFAGAATIPTFSGGTISVAGPATVTNATAGVASFNGPTASINSLANTAITLGAGTALSVASGTQTAGGIAGAGSLTKSGGGTLILGFDNAYSGGTTVAGGALQIGTGGTTGSIVGNVSNSGSVVFNRANALTFAGVVGGTGSLTQNGTGVLTLTGHNTFTGGTTVARGTLQFGDGTTAGSVTGNVSNLGTVVFNTPAAGQSFPGSIGGAGAISKVGVGTQVLTGANTASGGLTISAGKLQVGNGGTVGSLVGNVTNHARLAFNRSDNVTFGGTITGSGQIEQAGTGTLVLSASVDNGLIATRGRVLVGASTILDGDVTVAAGGRVENAGGILRIANLDNAGIISGTADLTGTFTNRASGNVRLASGQRMYVQSTGGHSNAGLIEVLGSNAAPAEFESVGSFSNVGGGTGMIVGRNASLRMSAGLANAGVLSFSYGQNDVFGDVGNQGGGTITIAGGAGVTFYDDVVQNGSLVVSATGATVSSAVFLGGFSGAGGFTGGGDVFLMGDLRPGNSPADVAFGGNLYLAPSTRTVIELGGTQRGDQYDCLTVAGEARLGGSLDLARLGGYAPAPLVRHRILSAESMNGAFGAVTGTSIGGRAAWAVTYDDAGVNVTATVLGDANVDGVVDFADLVTLAQRYGQATPDTGWTDGDYNYDQAVDFGDLVILAQNYQQGAEPSASGLEASFRADWALAQSMVPEPTVAVAAMALGSRLAGRGGRRRTGHRGMR